MPSFKFASFCGVLSALVVISFVIALNLLIFLFKLTTILLAALSFYNFYWKRRNLPPGPIPWPLIGNFHTINANPTGEAHFLRWAEEYGPVYTFWLGEIPIVMMTDYAQIVDTFVRNGDAFAGRAQFKEMDKLLKGGTFGVVGTEGELWREHRRFVIHVFRDFGVGKNLMQDKILTEIGARFAKLDSEIHANENDGRFVDDFDIAGLFDVAVGSIINDLLFGYRFDGAKSDEFYQLKLKVRNVLSNFAHVATQIMNICPPVITRLPYFRRIFATTRSNFNALCEFYRRQIDAHCVELNANDAAPCTDYVGAYLREAERRRRAGDAQNSFSIDQLVQMCFDLWVAGQETTSRTLTWSAAYLINRPDVQRKLQAELDAVIGDPARFINVADRPNLPYTNAIINEVQRLGNIVTINLLHRTTCDVTVNGYSLPKGTRLTPQISAIFYNEKYFDDPLTFHPERFLNAEGQLIKCDYLIPFGVGKRQCLGEALARTELFLFIANIFNRYTLTPATRDATPPSLRRLRGGAAHCPDFRCRVTTRVT